MKKIFLLIPAVALLATGCSTTQQVSVNTGTVQNAPAPHPPTQLKYKTYLAQEFGFQIDYPEGWKISAASEMDQVAIGYQFDNYTSAQQDFYAFIVTRDEGRLSDVLSDQIKTKNVPLANGMASAEYDNTSDDRVTEQQFYITSGRYVYTLDFQVHHANVSEGSNHPTPLSQVDIAVRDQFIKSFKITK